jgi:hypothetical protein
MKKQALPSLIIAESPRYACHTADKDLGYQDSRLWHSYKGYNRTRADGLSHDLR